MSKTKYLALSVVFAITYIACDLSYVFYVADKAETNVSETHNNTVYQHSYNTIQKNAYALNNARIISTNQTDASTATIVE